VRLASCRLYWDLVMLVLLLANMITLPVAISFFNDDLSAHWIIFNGVCDTVFLTDLIINFRTGMSYDLARFLSEVIGLNLSTFFILIFQYHLIRLIR